ncbi:MAG: amidohydrolase [Bacteroides sp.]|nr:amidohydrolase [Prevotella sp.]MCM1406878.1 amidohydrolase [Treponema brennaborense]MCM1470029.1 amidohydrolase [Bacteroides sp.]
MKIAFDAHMHLLPLHHICFSAYLSFLTGNWLEVPKTVMAAPDYLAKDIIKHTDVMLNLLNIAEQTVCGALCSLEDDLRGEFGAQPMLGGSGFSAGGAVYDYLFITPLIMDFTLPDAHSSAYYSRMPEHDVIKQAADILAGIREYRIKRPESRIIVRPFLGINTRNTTAQQLENLLETHFYGYSPRISDALKTWKKLPGLHAKGNKPYPNAFAGIKVYPPLDFDPYPDNPQEREKLDMLYSFCQKKKIPLITHCDDQGFRAIPQEASAVFTSPERWELVLRSYPDLRIDIAHFGKQYSRGYKFREETQWRDKILQLMLSYPHVYSDLAFNGVDTNVWEQTEQLAASFSEKDAQTIGERLLFGTDWPLSLIKIQSAAAYWHGFSESPASAAFKERLVSANPCAFNFGTE